MGSATPVHEPLVLVPTLETSPEVVIFPVQSIAPECRSPTDVRTENVETFVRTSADTSGMVITVFCADGSSNRSVNV